jgi:molecular chaperone GrpE
MPSSPASEHGPEPTARAAEASPEELRHELEDTRQQLRTAQDRELRARADLDNYRKRAERELDRRVLEQHDDIVRAWLEAVDSVERALALESEHPEVVEGLRAVLDQMDAILARQGVERIGRIGEPFDPEVHEAVAVVSDDRVAPGTVAEIARFGYSIGDRVLRPAQVVVARSPAAGD